MTRAEHMEFCKKRALEYIKYNDLDGAFQSMMSDLIKHDETRTHPGMMMGMQLKMGGMLNTSAQMKKFIEDFN